MVHVMLISQDKRFVLLFYISTFRNFHIIIIIIIIIIVVVVVVVVTKGRLEWQVSHVICLVYWHINHAEVICGSQPNCSNVFSVLYSK